MSVERFVIVGGGLAGHRAAEALRRAGYAGEAVLISDEEHPPYDRPPLSKQLLAGTFEPEALHFGEHDDPNLSWTLGRGATGLDVDRGVVLTDDGEVQYDALLIATGRRARAWPDLPEGMHGFHTLRTLDDAAGFKAAVAPDTPVAIIGAGFIGCEVAATLKGLGVEHVAVIDVAEYPMPVLGPEIGTHAIDLHTSHGVDLRLGARVAGFTGGDHVEAVELEDGTSIPAGLVLIAVGSAPNSEWLADSPLQLDRGAVLCDEHCIALGTENIAVAGDIAAWPHPLAESPVCIEHWAIARDMAAVAATNLVTGAAERKAFAPVPTFWSDQYDVKIKSAGLLSAADRYEIVEEDPERRALIAEAYRGDELVGAVVFNKNKAIISYTRRLKEALATA